MYTSLKRNWLQKVHFQKSQALCIPPQQTLHSLEAQASMQPCQLAGHWVRSLVYTPHPSTKAIGIKPSLVLRPSSVKETLYLQTDFPVMYLVSPLSQKTAMAFLWVFRASTVCTPSFQSGLHKGNHNCTLSCLPTQRL